MSQSIFLPRPVSNFDSRAGPSFVNRSFLHRSWRITYSLLPVFVWNQPINIKGCIKFVVVLDDLHVYASFRAVENLIVKIVLGALYVTGFLSGVFTLKRRDVPMNSSPVTILYSNSFDKVTSTMMNDEPDCNASQTANKHDYTDNLSKPVRTSWQCITHLFPDSYAFVAASTIGLITLSSHPNIAKNRAALTTKRVIKDI